MVHHNNFNNDNNNKKTIVSQTHNFLLFFVFRRRHMLRLFSDDDGVAIVVGNQSVSTVETTNSLARITIWPPRNGSQSHSFHIHTTKMWLWLLSSSLPRRYVNFLFRRAPKRFVCFFPAISCTECVALFSLEAGSGQGIIMELATCC
jgi:hypothetical protein